MGVLYAADAIVYSYTYGGDDSGLERFLRLQSSQGRNEMTGEGYEAAGNFRQYEDVELRWVVELKE